MRRLWAYIAAALTLAACIREVPFEERPGVSYPEGAKVTIPFEVMTEVSGDPETRTIILGEDTPLDNMYLAVFGSSGYLKEYVQATDIVRIYPDYTYYDASNQQHTVAHYTFNATLTLAESRRIIHFLGNGPSSLSFGYADAVLPTLLSGVGVRSYWQTIEVDGIHAQKSTHEYDDHQGQHVYIGDFIDIHGNKITDGTGYVPTQETVNAFQNIPLIKNWARVALKCEPVEESNFIPYSFAVISVPKRGTIVPHNASLGFIEGYQNLTYEGLEGMGYPGNLPAGTDFDAVPPTAEDFQNCTNGVAPADGAVYLYERPLPSSSFPPSSLIIYGHYRNPDDLEHEDDYYYKVDLMEGDDYYPIFRNFKYQVDLLAILSQGHHTPEAAAAASGTSNVSADINASHLSDISDGRGRLIVEPYMSHTFTGKVNDGLLRAFFVDNVYDWTINMNPGDVTVEALPVPDGEPEAIESVYIDAPDENGWRNIHFTSTDPGSTAHTQTIRITGKYNPVGIIYRDVVITIQELQPMRVRCTRKCVPHTIGAEQTVEIVIPDGLAESMFPLTFEIEAEDLTLTPKVNVANNNLPVEWGPSFSEHNGYTGKPSYHFLRTLTWNEYRSLETEQDEDKSTWRVLPCYFKTNCEDSATTVWVHNDYFDKASDDFLSNGELSFRNLAFTTSIPRREDAVVTVHFDISLNPYADNPDEYPMVTMFVSGMEPDPERVAQVPGMPGYYNLLPLGSSVDLDFITTTDNGELLLELTADEYEPGTLRSHYYSRFGFVDGHKLWKNSAWSNIACGYINAEKNKTVLFGYWDDPDGLDATIDIKDLHGLVTLYPSSFPSVTEGPRSTDGDRTYHELEFKTTSSLNYNPAGFTLASPGYVEEEVSAPRFYGNILTQDKVGSDVLKPSNTYGFSVDTPYFTMKQDRQDANKPQTFTVRFDDGISDLRSTAPAGLILNAGGTYRMTVISNDAGYYPFYVQIAVRANYNWNGTLRTLAPKEANPAIGTFEKYAGAGNQYIWHIPKGHSAVTLELVADDDFPINITDILVKTYNARFY